MNKKQLRKELQRIQEVEQELNVRIDKLEEVNNELVESNNELVESNNELVESNNELVEQINEQKEQINEQKEKINEQLEETKEIRRVQEEQGVDIAALAKTINNLEDKKMFFEDEYAEWEDRFNKISEFIDQNPEFKGLGVIDRGALKQAMNDATNSIEQINEKLCKLQKFIKDIQKFDEFNYNKCFKR